MAIDYLCVYGSLMRHEPAHATMVHSGCRFIKDAVVHDMILVHLGNFPGAVRHEGTSIVGEIWAVPEDAWPRLDRYEGMSKDNDHTGLYRRRTVVTTGGDMVDIYLLNPQHIPENPEYLNDWRERKDR